MEGKNILYKKIVLDILRKYNRRFISGEKLSSQIGVTRATVWKTVQALRKEGFKIEARTRKGYCLWEEPDRLRTDELADLGIYYHPSVDSTNVLARKMAEEGCPGETVIIAEEQLLGRGRRGRSWSSPPGKGLWFSLLLRPEKLTPAEASPVTLVVSVALARTLREKTGLLVTIKWPNDLLVRGRKLGGILTEVKGEPDRIDYLIIGIGINVLQGKGDFPPNLRQPATSLYMEGNRSVNRTSLFLMLLEQLTASLELFTRQGFSPFRNPWKELNSTLGRRVYLTSPGGNLQGRAVDVDSRGALIIEDDTGTRHIVNYGELQNNDPQPPADQLPPATDRSNRESHKTDEN